MKNKIYKLLICVLAVFLIIPLSAVTLYAATAQPTPYESYTYWNNVSNGQRKKVYNRAMFEAGSLISANDIGVSAFEEMIDICLDKNGNIYLLDTASRIVVLNSSYELLREITEIKADKNYSFNGAKSLYIDVNNNIYLCDTENKRVITCDIEGNQTGVYTLPDSPLIPEGFDFKPIRVAADSKGYVYILCEGSYYGALLYAPDKSFVSFYGADTVANGVAGTIQSLFKRMFPNNAKSSNAQRVLPFTFTDIVIDSKNFVYTATDSGKKEQIKKLNPGAGNNILNKVSFVDDELNLTFNNGYPLNQKITGVDVDDNGFIYCLDSAYGRIFVYDSEGRMLTAFGGGMGSGTQSGTFTNASGICVTDSGDILISDKTNNNLTVFSANDYCKNVLKLTKMTIDGDYAEAKIGWEEVLKQDSNLQFAYSGLARAYLAEGNYEKAMQIAKSGYDRDTYALAFEYYRTNWLLDNFTWVFVAIVGVIAILIAAVMVIKVKKLQLVKNKELKLMLSTPLHPVQAFADIKEKKMGSVKLSVILVLLFYVTAVVEVIYGGFMFTAYDPAEFNSLWVFLRSTGLIVLWVAANWLVCTLLGGNGKLKEIFIVTSYSLIPIIVERVIWVVLSNLMLPSESAFLGILSTVVLLYSFVLLTIGMLKIHDFSMARFVGTSLLTVLGIAAIVFLLILIAILIQLLGGFVMTVLIEMFM